MGKSSNSHDKKSDKETQSPMLKIFRDIMQRENADPEKTKLLKEKRKNKKKFKYPMSKSDMAKSGDSSANEHKHRNKMQYNVNQQRNREYGPSQRTSSFPFPSDKKDSWWFWGGSKDENPEDENPKNDETCSCVSCALKKIVGNEYACIGCLLCLFTISAIFAFLLVSQTLPVKTEKVDETDNLNDISRNKGKLDSDSMKKTIEMLSEKRGDFGSSLRDRRAGDTRNVMEDSLLKQLGELGSFSDSSEMDYGDSSLRETNGHVDSNRRADGIFKIVLDANKIKNERLKGFYKKLIETDIKIKNLKKGIYSTISPFVLNLKKGIYSTISPFVLNVMPSAFPDRLKRSLFHRKLRIKVPSVKNLTGSDVGKNSKGNLRIRRFENGSLIPSGFLFEKKKLFMQYMPIEKKIYPKCSHVPKDSKSHEHEQKHPFYKNSQRLDEMLDQLLDKSFPEILSYEPRSEIKMKCHHETVQPKSPLKYVYDTTDKVYDKFVKPNVSRAKKIKSDFMKMLKTETSTTSKEEIYTQRYHTTRYHTTRYHTSRAHSSHARKVETKETLVVLPTENYDLVLSISTLINPMGYRATKLAPAVLLKKPGRKLQQFEEDVEEGIGYDDVKEVLSDDMATHDDTDRQVERKKRDDFQFDTDKPVPPIKYNPPGVHNPNWKGPMPLYPDELSTMMKHDDTNKDTETPSKTQLLVNNATELQWLESKTNGLEEGQESDVEDVQYIEDYSKNKYDKLVQMAQAYSDYGVLDLKKEQKEKNQIPKEKEHRIKLATDDQNLFERGLIRRPKKGSESEGMRFEIRHDGQRDDSPIELFKSISKHMKIINDDRIDKHGFHSTTLLPVTSDLNLLYLSDNSETTKKLEIQSDDPYTHFNLGPLKRSAKFDLDSYYKQNLTKEIKNDDNNYFKRRSLKSIDLNFDYNSRNLFQVSQDNYVKKHELPSKARLKRNIKYTDIEKIITDDSLKLFSKLNDVSTISEIIDTEESNTQNISLSDIKVSNGTEAVKVTDSKVINGTENINVDVKENNANNPIMDASEFFSVLSNWFSTLSGLSNETGILKGVSSNISNSPININETELRSTTEKTTKYLEYPMYDSDMVDNIGHRSRVLLSVQENMNVSAKALGVTEMEDGNAGGEKTTDDLITVTVKTNYDTTKFTTVSTNTNAVTDKDANTVTNEMIRDSSNKTLVKRNAEDSNLIFWNDMYDEEYGIQEPLENTLGDKHTLEKNLKTPGTWFHDKIKKLTDSLIKSSSHEQNKINPKPRKKPLLSRFGITKNPKKVDGLEKPEHKIVKRDDEVDEYETDEEHRPSRDKEINFTFLNNHMKQVLKQAAEAVKKTKNIEVREDTMTGAVTSNLMQQLVKLMSDLVDFQVEQKTCLQLPNDLKNFLAWLTNKPGSAQVSSKKSDVKVEIQDYVLPEWKEDNQLKILSQVEAVATQSSVIEPPESRADCLGILEAVRDLMQQYNALGEEEKSKMTDVKEYLDNQLIFLNKKLTELDQDNLATLYANDITFRYRRDITTSKYDEKPIIHIHKHRGKRRHRRRLRRKLNRFLRNYGKKHTKTTASYVEFLVSTDVTGKKRGNAEKVEFGEGENLKREVKNEEESEKTKRNLIDVYYKALADAKIVTTEKVYARKDFEAFDKA